MRSLMNFVVVVVVLQAIRYTYLCLHIVAQSTAMRAAIVAVAMRLMIILWSRPNSAVDNTIIIIIIRIKTNA